MPWTGQRPQKGGQPRSVGACARVAAAAGSDVGPGCCAARFTDPETSPRTDTVPAAARSRCGRWSAVGLIWGDGVDMSCLQRTWRWQQNPCCGLLPWNSRWLWPDTEVGLRRIDVAVLLPPAASACRVASGPRPGWAHGRCITYGSEAGPCPVHPLPRRIRRTRPPNPFTLALEAPV